MASLNDLIVSGKARFLNTISGNIDGTSSNVTGTVAIAHGGTGATTRLGAAHALTNQEVVTPGFVVGLTDNWGKFGYTSIANLKTTIGSAAAASGGTAKTLCTTGEKYTWNNAATTVKQNLVSVNEDYRILLSGSNSAYGETESANKSNRLTFNPYNLILNMNADSNNYVSLSTGTGTSSQLHLYNTGTSLIVLSSGSGTSVKTMGIYANNISNSSTWDGTNTSLVTAVTNKLDKSGGTMTGDLTIKGTGGLYLSPSSTSSDDAADIIFTYGDGTEKARIWCADNLGTTNDGLLYYRSYKTDGTAKVSTTAIVTQNCQFKPSHQISQSFLQAGQAPNIFINNSTHASWIGGNTKNGRITLNSYPSTNDLLYFAYYSNTTLNGSDNKYDRAMTWNGSSGDLTVPGFIYASNGRITATYINGEAQLIAEYKANASTTNSAKTYIYQNQNSGGLYTSLWGAIIIKNASQQVSISGNTYSVSNAANFRSAIGAAASSSIKTKKNIDDLTEEEAKKLLNVNVKSFDYKEQFINSNDIKRDKYYGVIAEDVIEQIPYVVNIPKDYSEETFDESRGLEQSLITVDYDKFVPYLIKMVQIQQKEIDELKTKLEK